MNKIGKTIYKTFAPGKVKKEKSLSKIEYISDLLIGFTNIGAKIRAEKKQSQNIKNRLSRNWFLTHLKHKEKAMIKKEL